MPVRHANILARFIGSQCWLTLGLLAGVLSCEPAPHSEHEQLTIFAAASLTDVVHALADRFAKQENIHLFINTGSSGKLFQQLRHGASCDVYLPAATSYLDQLEREEAILPTSRTPLSRNGLVVVTPGQRRQPWPDLSKMRDATLGSIAIASPEHAPAGRYATEALKRTGHFQTLRDRLLFADNVRMAARYVATGAVQVGIIYASDALAFEKEVSIVYRFRDADHGAILYEGAVCRMSSRREWARAFLEFARSEKASECWRRSGFLPLVQPDDLSGGR